ncbi:MAG: D-sedoheptulose 7-phosphate isomerase [Saprospiraceae bacterium]|jgi:D-sedoheptulose 7-phosphate isomerase|tara:strand:- start:915 stop:1499 length:585 start_codon:yes stop_codon:yes gene_type:complete
MDKRSIIKQNIEDSIALKSKVLADQTILSEIDNVVDTIIRCYQEKGKVLFCGNGGSAADSQHLAAELSGRYYYDRPPLPAEALHVNTSYLTAVANDYSYNEVYARLLQAIGNEGDVLIGLSTSGNSENVVEALKVAREKKMITVGFTGEGGGKMADYCDMLIPIPSKDTPRIQECHLMIGHAVCQIVELSLFPQ